MRGEVKKAVALAALFLLVLSLFAGCASMTGETAGENIDDNTITTEAKAIIVKDPDVHYLKISVETHQGDVVLTGFVNNKEAGERLAEKIKGIRGVKSVTNLLQVEEK